MGGPNLSERQQKWFASVRDGLERETGKSLAQWVEIARQCPEDRHRARLKWFKDQHGLLQNRASYVLDEAFGAKMGWSKPQALIDALWIDADSRRIFAAVDQRAIALSGAIRTARKGYTAWARQFQFAALRPLKGGGALLGLALPTTVDGRLEPPRHESWSERLKSRLQIPSLDALPGDLADLLGGAWTIS